MPKFLTLVFKPALAQFFGNVAPPPGVDTYGGSRGEGLITFLNNFLRLLIVVAGIVALFNFIIAGYDFINAGGDTQKVTNAWNKIWQSALGLLFVAASFTLLGVFGRIIFGPGYNVLSPTIYGP